MNAIPTPKELILNEGNTAEQWRRFREAWNNYELATGIYKKSNARRVATFLTVVGEAAVEAYETFTWENEEDRTRIDEVLQKFEQFCIPRNNVLFETYRFTTRRQEQDEQVDKYVTALRKIADNCEFEDKSRRLRDQLVFGIRDDRVRERLLREGNPDLQAVIDAVRANEAAAQQSSVMSEGKVEEAHLVRKRKLPRERENDSKRRLESMVNCKYCGGEHVRDKLRCPAYGKSCNKCSKKNHFAACCRNQENEAQVTQEAKQVTFDLFSVTQSAATKKTKTAIVVETGQPLTFHIDTGASCNVLPSRDYARVTGDHAGRRLKESRVQLKTYGGKTYVTEGSYKLAIKIQGQKYMIEVHVVKIDAQPLLSLSTCEEIGILKILDSDQGIVHALEKTTGLSKEDIINRFPSVFKGIGKLKGKYKIQVDEAVIPVVHAPRKFPVTLREELRRTLDQLEKDEIIAKVSEPTDWVSSLMVVREPGKFRICIDPKDLNKAIKREHYPLPCIEEVTTRLSKAKVFSVLDARKGFWQIELEETSSYLTTFNTPFGRYRWRRMPFGVSSAPEVWQRRMHEIIEGLKGVEVIADDHLVVGCGDTLDEAIKDHDKNIMEFMKKAEEENLTLNSDKIRFKMNEVQFIGHLLTADGVKPDPRKVEAIKNMPTPSNESDVRRLLGMIQYLAKFLPNLSDATEPLRKLTVKDAVWQWSSVEEQAFKKLKQKICEATVLAYYDPAKPVTIQTDASEGGLGGVLMQEGRPIHFTSRAMSTTEKNYEQIEKEMLAIVHACTKFNHYVYGRADVIVETDHKPLEVIFKKPIAGSPKRLQRMLLFLQKYQLQVRYKKGSELYIADTLSRAYLDISEHKELGEVCAVEEKVRTDLQKLRQLPSIPNSKKRIEEIREATRTDKCLQIVHHYITQGWPEHQKCVETPAVPYFQSKDELTTEDGIILKGNRIVIPHKLRHGVMMNIHNGHIGIENCLRRAREYVYWPGMNSELKSYISKCDTCNTFKREQGSEPMLSHELPSRAWQVLSTDLFTLSGTNYLLLVDHYSNYFEYDRLQTGTSMEVVQLLKKHFARYGIPEKLISDNGPQFRSEDFTKFAREWEFDHITSSPLYPKGNGKAENTVKTCKLLMKKAMQSNGDFHRALMDWRNTPDEVMGLSPSQKLFGRRMRTLLPAVNKVLQPEVSKNVTEKMQLQRKKQKEYYDQRTTLLPKLRIGANVRIKLPGRDTWSNGTIAKQLSYRSYVVMVDGKSYRRNRRAIQGGDFNETEGKIMEQESSVKDHVDQPRRSARLRKATNFYKF